MGFALEKVIYLFVPTKTVTLLSDATQVNEHEDEEVVYTAIGTADVYIWEQKKTVFNPVDGRNETIRTIKGLAPAGTDIEKGYRLVDGDDYYLVDHIVSHQNFIGSNHMTLELRIVS